MRSPRSARLASVVVVVAVTIVAAATIAAAVAIAASVSLHAADSLNTADQGDAAIELRGSRFTSEDIARAIEKTKADPNLATERTVKTMRWKDSSAPRPPKRNATVPWSRGFFQWIDQSSRLIVYGTIFALAAILLYYIVRLLGRSQRGGVDDTFNPPTHVGELDIRPEALPHDIGGAARALWDRGEHRAALALLYRGLLSRLVHVHRMPIRDSSTEGDCLALVARHLPPRRRDYASRLVQVWLRSVYGREDVQTTIVHVLCEEFAPALDSGGGAGTTRIATSVPQEAS